MTVNCLTSKMLKQYEYTEVEIRFTVRNGCDVTKGLKLLCVSIIKVLCEIFLWFHRLHWAPLECSRPSIKEPNEKESESVTYEELWGVRAFGSSLSLSVAWGQRAEHHMHLHNEPKTCLSWRLICARVCVCVRQTGSLAHTSALCRNELKLTTN